MKVTDRHLLFWGVCIPLRLHLAGLGDVQWLRILAGMGGARWILGYVDNKVGVTGGPAWWANERPLHGILWSTYALTGNKRYLLADVWLGVINWFLRAPRSAQVSYT